MRQKTWSEAIQDACITGAIAGAATMATVAIAGRRESGSAVAPINASSHVVYGSEAADVAQIDRRHTPLGFIINMGAAVFWAAIYEKAFGAHADRGNIAEAWFGGKAVAGLAYMADYHAVPKRLTPGWEERVSGRSLMPAYAALALSLPVRGLLRSRFWQQPEYRERLSRGIDELRRIAEQGAEIGTALNRSR